jgi:ABC-type glycerol-3-phosphate transport system permease component
LVIVVPFLWILFVALKPLQEALGYPPTFLPQEPTFQNFVYVVTRFPDLKRYYMNSIIVSAVVVPLVTFVVCMAGYSFARLRYPGRDQIFWVLVITMFFPLGFTRLFTIFEITRALKLADTLAGLMLPYLSLNLVLYTFIMRGNFRQIPVELEDAARIDGCSTWQTILHIMLPLAKSGITVVAILCFITVWDEFLYALTLTTEKARTLPIGLSLLTETTAGETAFNILAAAYTLAILPPVLLFVIFQRVFMRGLTAGALKF